MNDASRFAFADVLGDGEHIPFGNPPLVSKKITVKVLPPKHTPAPAR